MFWTLTLPYLLAGAGALYAVTRLSPRAHAFALLSDTPMQESRWDWDAKEVDDVWAS